MWWLKFWEIVNSEHEIYQNAFALCPTKFQTFRFSMTSCFSEKLLIFTFHEGEIRHFYDVIDFGDAMVDIGSWHTRKTLPSLMPETVKSFTFWGCFCFSNFFISDYHWRNGSEQRVEWPYLSRNNFQTQRREKMQLHAIVRSLAMSIIMVKSRLQCQKKIARNKMPWARSPSSLSQARIPRCARFTRHRTSMRTLSTVISTHNMVSRRTNRSGVWLNHCPGSFGRGWVLGRRMVKKKESIATDTVKNSTRYSPIIFLGSRLIKQMILTDRYQHQEQSLGRRKKMAMKMTTSLIPGEGFAIIFERVWLNDLA